MKKVNLKIYGMDCEGCAKIIEKALLKEKGIVFANVNFISEKVIIEYDPSKTNEEKIKNIIEKAGYKVLKKEGELKDEIKGDWKNFFLGLFLSLPVWIISNFFYHPKFNLLLFILSTPVQIILGIPFYKGAYFALKQRMADLNVLVSLSTTSAYLYSFFATFLIKGPVFYEASSVVLTTITLGMLLEKISRAKVGEGVKKLMELQPKTARVLRNGDEIEVLPDEIEKGDIVVVRPGEKIPVDGKILEGKGIIDESMITGESLPIYKKEGDEVFGGTINKDGFLKIEVTKSLKDMTLSQIIKLVEEAQNSKARIQRLADKVSSYFVPIVVLISLTTFIFWYFLKGYPFLFALTASISVLVIACPCALGIATPMAVMVGLSKGLENGILIKGGEYLERAGNLNTIIFDKTGTLTKGEAVVTDILGDCLEVAASLAKNTNHPLDVAILKEAEKRKLNLFDVKDFEVIPGKGIKGKINGKEVLIGNRRLIESEIGKEFEEEGKTVILVKVEDKVIGAIAISDSLKEYVKETIEELKKMGIDVWMITGDNKKTAYAIGKKIGIENILAEVLPQDKEKMVRKLKEKGKIVGAVGDGINDAPMLASSDVGIAMGAGTDIAKETGGIILVKNDIRDVVKAIHLSKKTFSKIKQNLFLAFIYNILAIPVAAGVFYKWLGFLLRPEIAAFAMILSDISVVGNSLLLKRFK
jgi:Cu+-exporting ATPase